MQRFWLPVLAALLSTGCTDKGDATRALTADTKPASDFTVALHETALQSLPFDDRRDLEEQARGFIARPAYDEIMADAGHVAWSMGKYEFLETAADAPSIHPSLARQAILNTNYGLYKVVDGFYQVRGFDLSNMTLIEGDSGWIIFDPLTSKETARAALALANEVLGERPVRAVVYSHTHADHFGGVRGVVDVQDVLDGKVSILAPVGFMENAIAENVYAGNAMARRFHYQYGAFLEASPRGHVDQAIGKSVSLGNIGLIPPTRVIEQPIEELVIDGVRMVFQNTPGTEAPAEMNTWFPDSKVFWAAENVTSTIHNIYTLRGALVRDSLAWSKYLNESLYLFGRYADVMISSHNWPRWGNERVQEVMRGQRDMYAHLNNYTMHLANQGVTVNEIHNLYEAPQSQQQNWFSRAYHGSFEHNSRAVINRYLGYWDANPTTLIPLSPGESAPLYVEAMGGADRVLELAGNWFDDGRYRDAQELLNKLVLAEPGHRAAQLMLADTFEQIGYQQESASLRNSFLAAANELRHGIPSAAAVKTFGPDLVQAMSTGRFLDFIGIRLDAVRAEGVEFTINFSTPDNGERYVLELSNSALTNIEGFAADNADLDVTVNRSDLERVMAGQTTFAELAANGGIGFDGDPTVFMTLQSLLVDFDPKFEIMPGTARQQGTQTH